MALKEIQKDVDEWTGQFAVQYWGPYEMLARLVEETGELAREINHLYGPKKKKATEDTKEMADEMADVLFTLCCIANSKNIDLDESWQRMMKKLNERDNNRYAKK